MPARLTPAVVARIEKLHGEGYSHAEIGRLTGVHYNTVSRRLANVGQRAENLLEGEAQKALHDFGYFRARYFGRVSLPWHMHLAERVVELLATDEREYLVVNVPPGAGKSTALMDLAKWCIVRDRAVRILYGSAVQTTASDYTRAIMNDLTREDVARASSRDIAHGLATDAQATLQADFGRFKPVNGDMWRKEKFVVAQTDGKTAQNKEATVVAYGYDSGFLGGRYDLNIWDDLVTEKNFRTEEAREKMISWWESTAETRCEPGGLVVLNGQRLSGDDLYRHALDMIGGDADDLHVLDVDTIDRSGVDIERKYHHIRFPAHDEDRCQGPTVTVKKQQIPNPDHATTGKPWPEGCLLDPKRLSWRFLAPIRANRAEKFSIVYQQQDVDSANALVKALWIEGGTVDGITYPGCKNPDRMMWQLPANMTGLKSVYLTVDPSPTRHWSVQLWVYHHLTEKRFLLAHYRGPMTSPDFLDFDLTTQRFTGLAEVWWQKAHELGCAFTSMVVEENAAQKFMLQADFIQRWSRTRHVLLVPHKTHKNKADPEYGVQMLAPLFQHGLVDLPWKGTEALKYSGYLINEALKWPNGAFEDCIMSMWFGEHNLARIRQPEATVYNMPRPTWLRSA